MNQMPLSSGKGGSQSSIVGIVVVECFVKIYIIIIPSREITKSTNIGYLVM